MILINQLNFKLSSSDRTLMRNWHNSKAIKQPPIAPQNAGHCISKGLNLKIFRRACREAPRDSFPHPKILDPPQGRPIPIIYRPPPLPDIIILRFYLLPKTHNNDKCGILPQWKHWKTLSTSQSTQKNCKTLRTHDRHPKFISVARRNRKVSWPLCLLYWL